MPLQQRPLGVDLINMGGGDWGIPTLDAADASAFCKDLSYQRQTLRALRTMHRVASAVCAGSGLHAYFHFSSQSSSTAYCEARAAETPRKGENAALRFIRAHIIFRHGARTPVFPVGPTNAAYPIRWEMCSKGMLLFPRAKNIINSELELQLQLPSSSFLKYSEIHEKDTYLCSLVNQPPGTLVELYPDLPAAELARLSITDLDGKSPQPVSQVDARQFRTSLPGNTTANSETLAACAYSSKAFLYCSYFIVCGSLSVPFVHIL